MIRSLLTILVFGCAPAVWAQTVESFTEPYRKVDLVSAESGTLQSLEVREGDTVTKDQRLGALDCEVQEIALEIARANLEARGQLESVATERSLRKTRLERIQELRARGHATQDELERAIADLAAAEANFLAATEKRKIDELEYRRIAALIERRILKSPIDGVVTRLYKEEAEFVGGTTSPLMTIMQLDPLRITFSVPGEQAQSLRAGQPVALTLPDADRSAVGQIEFISPVTEAESGTVRVKVLLKNTESKYRCGVRCQINLDVRPTDR
jgi:RND family efflux transporter MFP subunit